MPSIPPNPAAESLSELAPELIVRLGDESGSAPVGQDTTRDLQISSLTRTAGGRELDYLRGRFNLSELDQHIENLGTPNRYARRVDVILGRVPEDPADPSNTLLFRGELTRQSLRIHAQGEAVDVVGRLEPYHFGIPLERIPVIDQGGTTRQVALPGIFNPEIDDRITGNRSDLEDQDAHHYVFFDPESSRTPEARTLQDQTASLWSLYDAVAMLCWWLNASETWFKNPVIHIDPVHGNPAADDELLDIFRNAPDIKNLRLPMGEYLPACLDALLDPYGYSWYVAPILNTDYEASGTTAGELHLKFFKRGEGIGKKLFLQPIGEELKLTKSNVPDPAIDWNIADLANQVTVWGSLVEKEITVELYRAWPESDDLLSADDLKKGADADGSVFANHRNAWRKWAMNEAGDYDGVRTDIPSADSGKWHHDQWATLFDDTSVPKRRRFYDCLTKELDGYGGTEYHRRQPVLEYYNTTDAEWQPLNPDWSMCAWRILDSECAIYFDGATPPPDLMDLGADARLRISACIRADTRLIVTATRESKSPNLNTVNLFLDCSDRFHKRVRQEDGEYATVLTGTSDTVDNTAIAQTFAERVRDVENFARLSADIILWGIVTAYEIGDLITRIDGRDIRLDAASKDQTTRRYMQVTGITYDRDNQRTHLHVETPRPLIT